MSRWKPGSLFNALILRQCRKARLGDWRYRQLFDQAPVMRVTTRNEAGIPIISDCNPIFLEAQLYPGPIHFLLSDVVMPGLSVRVMVDQIKSMHPVNQGALYLRLHQQRIH